MIGLSELSGSCILGGRSSDNYLLANRSKSINQFNALTDLIAPEMMELSMLALHMKGGK